MVSRGKKSTDDLQRPAAGGELALIERIRARTAGGPRGNVRLGIGDDCAILRVRAGEEMVVTTDFCLEDRHFRRDWHPAASVGHRALARGLSDIAAMGARPVAAFLSLALPREVARDARWIDGFLDGLLGLAAEWGVPLAGGDTSEAMGDGVIADIVLTGAAPTGKALRRSGARAGDLLYVTGALGGAAAELQALQYAPRRSANAVATDHHPHLFPQPRLSVGRALLQRRLATACLDVSDGISTDLAHLCEASGVGAEVDARALPVHPLAAKLGAEAASQAALHGGEDYELLFTARAGTRMPRSVAGVAITRIGKIVAARRSEEPVTLVDAHGVARPLPRQGWEHFA